jgi:hypothetical protein
MRGRVMRTRMTIRLEILYVIHPSISPLFIY